MELLLNALIWIGPITLLAGFLAALIFYVSAHATVGSFISYIWGIGLVGVGAFVLGTALGIGIFCAPTDAGNLCGLGGIFGFGPFVTGLTIGAYSYHRAMGTRAAP